MKNSLGRKISAAIVSILMVSMLVPVLVSAAESIFFQYYPGNGNISGSIYTSDPDNVSVAYITEDGEAVTIEKYPFGLHLSGYDENNTPYYGVGFSVYVGPDAPLKIRTTEGDTEFILNRETNDWGNSIYRYFNPEEIDIDAFRVPGSEYFNSKSNNTFLQTGDKLFSFTPSESGHKHIHVSLPYNYASDQSASINLETMNARDFTLTNATVTGSVYGVQLYRTDMDLYTTHSFVIEFPEELQMDVTYTLSLSTESGGNEILLPNAGSSYNASIGYGTYHERTFGDNKVYKYMETVNISKFKDVVIVDPTPTVPSPPSGPAPKPDVNADTQPVTADQLKNSKDGVVSVTIADSKSQVLLPANTAELVGDNKLQLSSGTISVEVPAAVLKQLQALLPADLKDVQIAFNINNVEAAAATTLLNTAEAKHQADINAAGEIYDFSFEVIGKDGVITKLSQFDEPLAISLKVSASANQALTGIYYISDAGDLEYVGGKLKDGYLTAEISHFSMYAVLEFDKSFTDVPAGHWAYDTIKTLSAKHIVNGVTTEQFAPEANVTRAEFTAMLVRALGLESTGTASYSDISSDAWYAGAVAAASEAGIMQGKSATAFAPNDNITREEMSAVLVRAFELVSGTKLTPSTEANFSDRNTAADWALDYIDIAFEAGFVNGRDQNQFAPKAHLTRAEGAKVIHTLLIEE